MFLELMHSLLNLYSLEKFLQCPLLLKIYMYIYIYEYIYFLNFQLGENPHLP